MADKFHRFVDPSYYILSGEFPPDPDVDYDLINVVSGGTGSGGSATADGQKSGGPNDGTYYLAFGEPATSNYFNRGMRALSENSDHLDNLFHRDVAAPTIAVLPVEVFHIVSVTIPAGTYLGPGGLTNDAAGLSTLFSLTDLNDDDVIDAGTHIVPDLVDGISAAILTGAGGFSTVPGTVTFNSTGIPISLATRLYYGARVNLATLPADALVSIKVRGAQEVSYPVENRFRLLHGNSEDWNAAWDSTIWDLARSGIDERYRRADFASPSPAPESYFSTSPNTYGSGGWYLRGGPAMTGYSQVAAGPHVDPDPFNAIWAAKFRDTYAQTPGSVGFVAFGKRSYKSGAQGNGNTSGFAGFLHVVEHLGATDANEVTYITPGTACHIIRAESGGLGGGPIATVTLDDGTNNWWTRDPSTHGGGPAGVRSAIAPGYDLVEIVWDSGSDGVKPHSYIIESVVSATAITVRGRNGVVPSFPASSTASTIKCWHSLFFISGDGSSEATVASGLSQPASSGFFSSALPKSAFANEDLDRPYAKVFSSAVKSAEGGFIDCADEIALAWGGYDSLFSSPNFGYKKRGWLLGNGNILSMGFQSVSTDDNSLSAAGPTLTLDWSTANFWPITLTYTGGSPGVLALTCSFGTEWGIAQPPSKGTTYRFHVRRADTCTITTFTIAGGATHTFSGTDQQLQDVVPGHTVLDLYEGFAVDSTQIVWTVKRFIL